MLEDVLGAYLASVEERELDAPFMALPARRDTTMSITRTVRLSLARISSPNAGIRTAIPFSVASSSRQETLVSRSGVRSACSWTR